jgi:copper chaperone
MHRLFAIVVMAVLTAGVLFAENGKSNTVKVSIDGMKCKECVAKVEKALKGVKGVQDVKVSLENKNAEVMLASNSKVTSDELVKAVSDAGFKASSGKATAAAKKGAKKETCGKECGKDCKEGAAKKDAKKDNCCEDKKEK